MFNKKVLCLGNNDQDTDIRTSNLAKQDSTVNHGLIADSNFVPTSAGYYHTTILDIPFGAIINLAQYFDLVIMLDQPVEQWSHPKPLLSTYKIMLELDKLNRATVYQDNNNINNYKLFDSMLKENKSFCIYPWINMIENSGHLVVCARSGTKVTTTQELKDWRTDPEYQKIRKKMLAGEKLPEHCSVCYDYESKGVESYRIFETKDWISKLNINSISDLDNIAHPYYHEVRLSNKCNLMCRSCRPEYSHLIDKEAKEHSIIYPFKQTFDFSSLDHIDITTLNKDTRVYLTGGEPTVMAEVIDWMRKCVELGNTDFDFTLGTNAAKLTKTFIELADNFSNMNFSISLDGFGKINDYWRWGSDWDTIVKNAHLLASRGHIVSINTVPGIYNVTNLHLLFEFLDREFPHAGVYLQINYLDYQSPYNHPNAELALESLSRCKQTNIYYSDGKSNKTCIDSLYDYYSNNPQCDLDKLKQFYTYNDKLDQARGVRLADYIPELEDCRKYLG